MEKYRLRLDVNNMMAQYVGAKGFTEQELENAKADAKKAFEFVEANRGTGMMGWTELPYNQNDIVDDIIATAKEIQNKFDYFVVLGIGGSALGPIAIQQALNHLHYNDLPKEKRGGCPKLFVEDNVDPERMSALFDVIELEKTCFNVISKSGSTSETMTQYLILWDALKKKLGDEAKNHIIATTDAEKGNLIKLCQKEGFKKYVIPDGVGGRFSEMCPVGLLAAAVCGIDIKAMLAGAAYMDSISKSDDIYANAPLMAATMQYLAMNKGCNISVMMPYADSLKFMADWYCQLWGESLGKKYDLDGNVVNVGQTPVKALGVTDQHSQVQLYTEGPFDKVVTIIGVDNYRTVVKIADGCEDIPAVNFLCGHTMNELITAERVATEYALLKSGHLNHTIMLPEVNAFTIGELMYFYELETAYCGAMLNINTFDQPGVEEGKNATYALLGRPGYDEKRAELNQIPQKDNKFIV
ncbi:MAG: glucose-6-phosphate isomerase [Clostridia bacterium]|nr:glucose-6-phosphate isomerase [Clostridia bacterium]